MPPPKAGAGKSKLSIRLADGGLRAIARREGNALPLQSEITAELARLGITHGIDDVAVTRLGSGRVPAGGEIVVAQGTAPKAGLATRIEYAFVPPKDNATFTSVEGDGRVDYREGLLNAHVQAGTVIARRFPGKPGVPGTNVLGQPIPAPDARDPQLVAGDNVKIADNGLTATATADGLATLDGDRLMVIAACTVRAVNYATGNVFFDGPVIVKGDVAPGFSVSATGDIDIQGLVEGATVVSGGNVIVRGGVRNGSRIEAVGDVTARFTDSGANLRAYGDVAVQTNAIRSELTAGGQVAVGRLVSGVRILAGTRIDVGEAGVESAVRTELEIRRDASEERVGQLQTRLANAMAVAAVHERAPVQGASTLGKSAVAALKRLTAAEVGAHIQVKLLRARLGLCGEWRAQDPYAGEILVRRGVKPGVRFLLHGSPGAKRMDPDGTRFTYQPPKPEPDAKG
jgi:uncharacterized protein (DUF342 family)